jgi:hypothetical protein
MKFHWYITGTLLRILQKRHFLMHSVTSEVFLFFFIYFLLTLQSYYIKNIHTAMIEGLDNRTRIPY